MHLNGQQPHILCIDNSPEILELQKELLEEEGFRITTWSRVDKNLDAIIDLAPDAIVLEYMWSDSDDEWAFLTMLTMHPRTQPIPVILCTGAIQQAKELEGHLDELGIKVVLKPFNIDHLMSVVSEAVRISRGTGGSIPSTPE
jgi:CheY-like chemotaxis protein